MIMRPQRPPFSILKGLTANHGGAPHLGVLLATVLFASACSAAQARPGRHGLRLRPAVTTSGCRRAFPPGVGAGASGLTVVSERHLPAMPFCYTNPHPHYFVALIACRALARSRSLVACAGTRAASGGGAAAIALLPAGRRDRESYSLRQRPQRAPDLQ